MNQRKLNNKGFSLVELIIVIAIMAVLIGLLAPQFLKYVQRSKYSTDVKNGQEIATVVQTLIGDNKLSTDQAEVEFSSSDAFAKAKEANMMGATAPTSKVSDKNKFYVAYKVASGEVTVTIKTDGSTNSSQVYPSVTGDYKTELDK